MKRLLTILAGFCLLMPAASAQKYLFPGSPQSKQKQEKSQQEAVREELKRIHGDRDALKDEPWTYKPKYSENGGMKKDSTVRTPAADTPSVEARAAAQVQPVETAIEKEIAEALGTETVPQQVDSAAEDIFVLDVPETMEIALLLPIKSTGSPSANFLDYYSGALMAVRDLGNKGQKINLSIYDTADAGARITDSGLAEADVIIGPVSAEDISKTLARCPEGKFIVSPIEPKAAGLTQTCPVIQVPAPATDQIDELVKWLKEDTGVLDTVILLEDEMADAQKAEARYLVSRMKESGLQFITLKEPRFNDIDFTKGEVRIVVASERDSFLCSSVNSIGKLGLTKGNVTLYTTSRTRSMEGINAESMFNAHCHMTSNYFVDYSNPETRSFILSYRALFQNEPSSFSFHGYDTVMYFATMCAKFGRQWHKKIQDESWRGMQTDFMFNGSDKAGMVNSAIRRIVYSTDLSTALQ